jgi:hypothetical protein
MTLGGGCYCGKGDHARAFGAATETFETCNTNAMRSFRVIHRPEQKPHAPSHSWVMWASCNIPARLGVVPFLLWRCRR